MDRYTPAVAAVFFVVVGALMSYLTPACPLVNVTTTTDMLGITITTTTQIPKPDCNLAKNAAPVLFIALGMVLIIATVVRAFRP